MIKDKTFPHASSIEFPNENVTVDSIVESLAQEFELHLKKSRFSADKVLYLEFRIRGLPNDEARGCKKGRLHIMR
jgi:hypothetical protein